MGEQNIVFLKVGTPELAPADFYGRLAEDYAADVHRPEDIFRPAPDGTLTPRKLSIAREELAHYTVTSLKKGRNVIFDSHLNQFSERKRLYDRIQKNAARTGAKVISLAMEPKEALPHVEWPWHNAREDELYIRLDPTQGAEKLLAQVATKISHRQMPQSGIEYL